MSRQIQKLLIANRGEVACRIIKTAQRMGIPTVAIYSTEDSNSLHVRLATEAVKIPGKPTESYLSIPNIIEVAKLTGSDALHPGFGFLSENPKFVREVVESNILFVGPNANAIEAMGDKLNSKNIAKRSNVSCVPGHNIEISTLEEAVHVANKFGFPVILKASAGGGGKGIRIIKTQNDLISGFDLARSEAVNAFGDSRLIIEKYLENAKHIEIQIIADKYGNVVHLPERDCSVQRRHQKVIEESPSTLLDPALRKLMGEQCIAMAKDVKYDSVGTFEFLISGNKHYFLEMNTRLQVEHPLSEIVTGLDVVEQMILMARGDALQMKQSDIKCNGWAMESRIYAEDPETFLPSSGQLTKYAEPYLDGDDSIRCDSGVTEGSEISIYYDPMICKLLAHGNTRNEAKEKMRTALDSFVIQGVSHNIPLIRDMYSQPSFIDGSYDTSFFNNHYPEGLKLKPLEGLTHHKLLCVAAMVRLRREQWNRQWVGADSNFTSSLHDDIYYISFNEQEFTKIAVRAKDRVFEASTTDFKLKFESDWQIGDSFIKANFDDDVEPFICHYWKAANGHELVFGGNVFRTRIRIEKEHEISEDLAISNYTTNKQVIKSPMPGKVVSIKLTTLSDVKKGQEICVIEAMKMQNVIKSPMTGTISKLNIKLGDSLTTGQIILEFQT